MRIEHKNWLAIVTANRLYRTSLIRIASYHNVGIGHVLCGIDHHLDRQIDIRLLFFQLNNTNKSVCRILAYSARVINNRHKHIALAIETMNYVHLLASLQSLDIHILTFCRSLIVVISLDVGREIVYSNYLMLWAQQCLG